MRGTWNVNGIVSTASPNGYSMTPKKLCVRYTSDSIGKSLSIADEQLGIMLQVPFDFIEREITKK